jgi:hypothetical protein
VARYALNQPLRLSTVTQQVNLDGSYSPANATALSLTVRKPDGTQQVYSSPDNDGTGLYHQDIGAADLQQVGHYQYVWTSTGNAAGVSFGDFDVFDPFETSVLPLADAKDMLNIPRADTSNDAELLSFIETVETSLEGFTGGPLVNRTITERTELTGGYTVLQVRQRPLVSVSAIVSVASGQALDLVAAGLDLDVNAGTVRRQLGYPFYGPFFTWLPAMLVTYVAGWGTQVPAAFNTCGRIIVKHMWETQHGPSVRPSMGGADMVQPPGFTFAIPNRAAELLNGSLNGMPFRLEAYV